MKSSLLLLLYKIEHWLDFERIIFYCWLLFTAAQSCPWMINGCWTIANEWNIILNKMYSSTAAVAYFCWHNASPSHKYLRLKIFSPQSVVIEYLTDATIMNRKRSTSHAPVCSTVHTALFRKTAVYNYITRSAEYHGDRGRNKQHLQWASMASKRNSTWGEWWRCWGGRKIRCHTFS